jgi:tetratricopeptide (TPR) repeat protein
MIDPNRLPLHVPAALVTFWGTGRQQAVRRFRETLGDAPGVTWLSEHQCSVTAIAGDPAVFDAAVALANGVLLAARTDPGRIDPTASSRLQVLICPCRVRKTPEATTLIDDPLVEDLREQVPRCAGGVVTMTSISITLLEQPRHTREAGIYEGPSGRLIPLFQVGSEKLAAPPWRNPAVLRIARSFVPLPEVAEPILGHLANNDTRLLRIEGPFGCGKTRAAWELLRRSQGSPPLWASARPARHGGPTLVSQLLAQVLQGKTAPPLDSGLDAEEVGSLLDPHRQPPRLLDPTMAAELLHRVLREMGASSPTLVVADSLESATANELETLNRLADLAEGSRHFRLILIARPATAWPESWWVMPKVAIAPMATTPMERFAHGLIDTLSLPKPVEKRLIAAAAGNPFALEEGLAGLIPLKKLRQVYGSFFFNGSEDTDFAPSPRLVHHAEAEAHRLGGVGLLRRLALADTPLPPSALLDDDAALAGVEDSLDPEGGADWRQAMIDHGWLRAAESPWGPGVELACPAHGAALASVLSQEDRERLRRELGERLWTSRNPQGKSAAWSAYQLLGASPEAIEPLLAAAQDPDSEVPPPELLERLAAAIETLRAGAQDPRIELELLWCLLPLARRLGLLQKYADDVDRAMELSQDDRRRLLAFASLKAELEERKGHLVEAIRTIRSALRDARDDDGTADQHASEAVLALQLGRLLVRREQLDEARELLEELVEALEKRGARSLVASCSFYLGNVAIHQERFNDALELHRSSLAERRKIGSPKSIGTSLSALGNLAIEVGRYVEALGAFHEAEEIFTKLGDEGEASFALLGISKALTRVGDYTAASGPVRRALALREQAGGDAVGQAIARLAVAKNYLNIEQPAEALREARHALFDLTLLTDATPRADAEQLLGLILMHQRHHDQAMAHFREAHDGHRKTGASRGAALDLAYWLDAALAGGNLEQIAELVRSLAEAVERCANSERREILELRLYKGLERLADHKMAKRGLALPHLERAYGGLMEKTQLLPPKDRHRFLFQISDHEEIVEAATAKGLSIPPSDQDGEPTTQPMRSFKQ